MTRSAGHERVHQRRVAAELGHRVAHDREVHDGRDAGQVLEEHARGHERDLGLGRDAGPPGRERLDVLRPDHAATGVAERVLQQDLDRDGRRGQVDPVGQDGEPVDVREARTERGSGAEGVVRWQRGGSSLARYTRGVQAYRDRSADAGAAR